MCVYVCALASSAIRMLMCRIKSFSSAAYPYGYFLGIVCHGFAVRYNFLDCNTREENKLKDHYHRR